jgi:hypothetical protein
LTGFAGAESAAAVRPCTDLSVLEDFCFVVVIGAAELRIGFDTPSMMKSGSESSLDEGEEKPGKIEFDGVDGLEAAEAADGGELELELRPELGAADKRELVKQKKSRRRKR